MCSWMRRLILLFLPPGHKFPEAGSHATTVAACFPEHDAPGRATNIHCMSDSSALESFLGKWRSRWPEWAVAEVFVPVERRALVVAWFALLQEFEDAMNVTGDPLPADAKLAWWGQELKDWSGRRSRHPLGRVLEPHAAPWDALADALPALIDARETPEDGDAALAQLLAYGKAAAEVEAVLLGGRTVSPDAMAVQVLAARLMAVGATALPRHVKGAGDSNASQRMAQWKAALLEHWPDQRTGARERRIHAGLSRMRLQRQGMPPRPVSRVRLLFNAWWAARGG